VQDQLGTSMSAFLRVWEPWRRKRQAEVFRCPASLRHAGCEQELPSHPNNQKPPDTGTNGSADRSEEGCKKAPPRK